MQTMALSNPVAQSPSARSSARTHNRVAYVRDHVSPGRAASIIASDTGTAVESIPEAKAALRAALKAHGGNTKNEKVVAAVEALASLNPTKAPAKAESLFGDWKQINSPEYPGMLGLDNEGKPKYTLGRLAFNLFEPKDLVCSISDILNPLYPKEGGNGTISYAIVIPFTFNSGESGPLVGGKLINFAECDILSENRISVRFLGGELRPSNTGITPEWEATFANALQTAKRGLGTRITGWLMKRMMGLQRPKEMAADGVMSYQMNKAPEGWLDVIFLDDELRITVGNRGTIVVAERS